MNAFRNLCVRGVLAAIVLSGCGVPHGQPNKGSEVLAPSEVLEFGTLYAENCAGCHGSALRSTDREVPNLTGDSFKRWVGGTIGEKFEIVRDTMPPRDERSPPDEVYLDILTFILRANKVPVGSHELKPDPETLKQIRIAEPG